MNKKLEISIKKIPELPGIYQFFDAKKNIIYIGKSVNLKKRVYSYFSGKKKLNFAKKKMLEKIADVKIHIVNNEIESLILETTLIKKYKPKYNILMKDDKNHLYIKITKEEFPQIKKTRKKTNSGEYFGPYLNGNHVFLILKFIKKHFGYGVGEHHFFDSKQSYNLDKYLFSGNKFSPEHEKKIYEEKISQIRNFLKKDYKKISSELNEQMKTHAKNLEFEQAGKIKETIEALHALEVNQLARNSVEGDYDIVNYIKKYESFFIGMIQIRDGAIVGFQNFEINAKLMESEEEILVSFLEQHIFSHELSEKKSKLPVLILPKKLKIPEIYSELTVEIPKIGTKIELLSLCYKNIYEYAQKKYIDSLSTKSFTKKTMQNILDLLGYTAKNKNIVFECNDISHISGNHTVASRSVIENGKTNPKKYRKYRIKTLKEQKIDDFNSMREVMTRRLKELQKLGNMPDLIVIDGGKGQLGSVMEVVESLYRIPLLTGEGKQTSPLTPLLGGEGNSKKTPPLLQERGLEGEIQIVSIAKQEEELFIYTDGVFKKFVLEKNSPELRLIQKLRDEAHRFAITFNRDSRIQSMKKNILESLPGFGPVTRKKLLKQFGSVENLKNTKKEELQKYLNKNQIETLEDHGIID